MEIDTLRKQIDQADDVFIKVFEQRMDIALAIASHKRENGLSVADPQREQEILQRLLSGCKLELRDYARLLYEELFRLSRSYQQEQWDR